MGFPVVDDLNQLPSVAAQQAEPRGGARTCKVMMVGVFDVENISGEVHSQEILVGKRMDGRHNGQNEDTESPIHVNLISRSKNYNALVQLNKLKSSYRSARIKYMLGHQHQDNCSSASKTATHSFRASAPAGFHPTRKRPSLSHSQIDCQSSSTWRNSTVTHRFPKQKRFSQKKSTHQDFVSLDIPVQRCRKSCSFGHGKRHSVSPGVIRRAQETPSPDRYDLSFGQTNRGNKFPSSRESQTYRYMEHRQDVYSPHFTKNNPAHIYNIRSKIKAKPIKFSRRLPMFTQLMADSKSGIPGPRYYPEDRALSDHKQLGNASFSTGQRIDFSKPLNENPGPKYHITAIRLKTQI